MNALESYKVAKAVYDETGGDVAAADRAWFRAVYGSDVELTTNDDGFVVLADPTVARRLDHG